MVLTGSRSLIVTQSAYWPGAGSQAPLPASLWCLRANGNIWPLHVPLEACAESRMPIVSTLDVYFGLCGRITRSPAFAAWPLA
jgi:hypothetical protein